LPGRRDNRRADSIDDMGLLRHGAMPALFGGIWARSTLGSFLHAFTWGNVLQMEKVSRLLLAGRGEPAPPFAAAEISGMPRNMAFRSLTQDVRYADHPSKRGSAARGAAWDAPGLSGEGDL
jgi:hypothetical protein